MRNSLFARYLIVFVTIILISFIILTAVICSNFSMLNKSGKLETIKHASCSISDLIKDMYKPDGVDWYKDNETMQEIEGYIKHMSAFSDDFRIFVINSSSDVIYHDAELILEKDNLSGCNISSLLTDTEVTGFDTLCGALGEKYLYFGKAIMGDSDEFYGAVFVCSSAQYMNKFVISTVKTMFLAALWVFLAALVAVYFITERIIGPLKQMSIAAKSYASGKFDVRIDVRGKDEVYELAEALNTMAQSLKSLEEMRSSFLANVSHDLKTPMTTISGFIDGILSGAIPKESQSEYLERIKSEVLRLSRLVRSLLDLSRIEAGDRKFEMKIFDICEIARIILLSFEQKIDEKHLDVEFNNDEDNMFVYADSDAIHQILYNICDNAVKFSKENGKYAIDIHYKNDKVVVSVYNEGQGIPESDLPFVFDRFYKSDKSRGLDKAGYGLGLYICKTIIDAHKETISVDSKQGEFCKFSFTLQHADKLPDKKRN